jgi:hypothetical protein
MSEITKGTISRMCQVCMRQSTVTDITNKGKVCVHAIDLVMNKWNSYCQEYNNGVGAYGL